MEAQPALLKSAWLALILVGCCLGQPPLSTEKVSVSGRVISVAGEPLRRVTLRLYPAPTFRGSFMPAPLAILATETDLQGNFHFDEVSPGRYTLSAERSGYLNANYFNSRGSVLTVKSDEKTSDMLIKMTPQGIIAGKVVDDENESLPGATVTVRLYSVPAPFQGMDMPGITGTTDADGAFAIGGLPPGRYVVSVAAPPKMASPVQSLTARNQQETYVTTYYPDATDLAQANPVEVAGGAQVRGLEVRLRRVPVYNVRGKVVNTATGEPGSPDVLSLFRQGTGAPGLSAQSTGVKAGEFSFEGVLPGSYILETKPVAGTHDHPPLVGYQIITVGNGDLDRVVVEMKPGIELSGRIIVEGAPLTSWPQITVTPIDGLNYLDSPMVDAEGRFALTGLEPARYGMTIGRLQPPMFLKSVRFNGLDLGAESDISSILTGSLGAAGIDLGSAPTASLEIVIAYGTSSISGVVNGPEGPVGPGVTVTATRKNKGPYLVTQTDENGRLSIGGVPPGEYFLIAMDNGFGMLPPKAIEKLGATVTVEEGVTAAADLRLTSNDDLRALDSR